MHSGEINLLSVHSNIKLNNEKESYEYVKKRREIESDRIAAEADNRSGEKAVEQGPDTGAEG